MSKKEEFSKTLILNLVGGQSFQILNLVCFYYSPRYSWVHTCTSYIYILEYSQQLFSSTKLVSHAWCISKPKVNPSVDINFRSRRFYDIVTIQSEMLCVMMCVKPPSNCYVQKWCDSKALCVYVVFCLCVLYRVFTVSHRYRCTPVPPTENYKSNFNNRMCSPVCH